MTDSGRNKQGTGQPAPATGRTTPDTTRRRFGVNYTPRRGWFHSWLDFNPNEVAEDLDAIAGLNLDHVRIFPLWPLLQPSRTLIRPAAVADIRTVVELAAERDLVVSLDVLQGHLSSFDFLPSWLTSWHRRGLFTDPAVIDAEINLVEALGTALADLQNFSGLTVGNETNQFAEPGHPDRHAVTVDQMGEWLRQMDAAQHRAAPQVRHQHSFDSRAWFDDESPVLWQHATGIGDVTTVHSWVFTATEGLRDHEDPPLDALADYQVQLAAGAADTFGRPVWLQEIGAPPPWIPAEAAADFVESAVTPVLSTPQFDGVTWWCSHDVDTALGDFPPLEYSLGLIASDGTVKPAGHRIGEIAAAERSEPTPPEPRRTAVKLAPVTEDGAGRCANAPGGPVWQAWLDLIQDGQPATLIRADLAADEHQLAGRGITNVVEPAAPPTESRS